MSITQTLDYLYRHRSLAAISLFGVLATLNDTYIHKVACRDGYDPLRHPSAIPIRNLCAAHGGFTLHWMWLYGFAVSIALPIVAWIWLGKRNKRRAATHSDTDDLAERWAGHDASLAATGIGLGMVRSPLLERLYKFRMLVAFGVTFFVRSLSDPLIRPWTCNDGFIPRHYGMIHWSTTKLCMQHGGFATNWSGYCVTIASFAIGEFVWLWLAEWNNRTRPSNSDTANSKLGH